MTMLPILLLVFASAPCLINVAGSGAHYTCSTENGSNLSPFQNPNWKIKMNWPCKYWALKGQQCGKYRFNLSPGNKWYYPFYQLDTVWLGIVDIASGKKWYGRTTNKKAVKYINAADHSTAELFTQRGGDLDESETFTTSAAWEDGVSITTSDGMAKFTFYPWDPMNMAQYKRSSWKFECFDPDMAEVEYPRQMCGGQNFKRVLKNMTVELGLKERFFPITHYYANFVINEDIVQTSDHCITAVEKFQQGACKNSVAQKMKVLSYCAPMLYNTKRTECLSFYNCHPMDAYISCLQWGCKSDFDPEDQERCKELSENIYFCPKIAGPGDLSAHAYASECYKGYVPIEVPEDEPEVFPEVDFDDPISPW